MPHKLNADKADQKNTAGLSNKATKRTSNGDLIEMKSIGRDKKVHNDTLALAFHWLNAKDLAAVSQVSHRWKKSCSLTACLGNGIERCCYWTKIIHHTL